MAAGEYAIPAVYRSIQVLTDLVASLPMREVIESVHVTSPATPPILAAPNPTEDYSLTIGQIMSSLLFRGNAYLAPRLRDTAGNVQTLLVLNPDEVQVSWDRRQIFRQYEWRGVPMERDREIIHIPINLWPGRLIGMGPIEAARMTLLGMQAESTFAENLWLDDATPGGIINVVNKLTTTEAKQIQSEWIEAHRGNRAPAVLSGGAKFEPLQISPADAQFIEGRNFSVQDIARLFGLHGAFLGVEFGGSLTYSTTESLMRFLVTATLGPTYLTKIEGAFSRLLPIGRRARFDVDELLRADLQARMTAYESGIRSGVLDVDEARWTEGKPRRTGGGVSPRELAEIIQKLYLGVGKVLNSEEARQILREAGAELDPTTEVATDE